MFLGQEMLEEHDAHYQYYRHGPLARQVIGHQQVQGIDYAYTLQGWMKGTNNSSLAEAFDMGKDAVATALDAFSYNLNYFSGDYQPIGLSQPFAEGNASTLAASYKPLYNGNINSMAVNIRQFNAPQYYNYSYDQLNRITGMDVYTGLNTATNSWSSMAYTGNYMERVSYDPNGNILKYLRQGIMPQQRMDSLTYFYNAGKNQLNYIRDKVGGTPHDGNYPVDLDDQSAGNYQYDSIGNLVSDSKNQVATVEWNVYGKIQRLTKSFPVSDATSSIDYAYDASGNRISKVVTKGSGEVNTTFYVRDAQGNVMAEYEKTGAVTSESASLFLKKHYLYGSSRLGLVDKNQLATVAKLTLTSVSLLGNSYVSGRAPGQKFFELSNHLGNVLVSISDRKYAPNANGSTSFPNQTAQFHHVDVVTANDYYPFGMLMPGRNYNGAGSKDYKFGFNGKENDNDVNGEGNQQDYGMRIYDPRAARFLSVDPIAKQYPELTPYQFASNRPIEGIDLDGLEFLKVKSMYGLNKFSVTGAYEISSLSIRDKTIHQIVMGHPRNIATTGEDASVPEVKIVKDPRDYGLSKSGLAQQANDVKAANQAMSIDILSGLFGAIEWGLNTKYDVKYQTELQQASDQIHALNSADNLVRAASESKGFPAVLKNSPSNAALTDLTNFVTDGTEPDGSSPLGYVIAIKTSGKLIYDNAEAIKKKQFDFTPQQTVMREKVVSLPGGNVRKIQYDETFGNSNKDVINAQKIIKDVVVPNPTSFKPG